MQPNAIQQNKDHQVKAATALKASTDARLESRKKAKGHLITVIENIEAVGTVPGLSDVRKIAAAIKHLALAEMASVELDMEELKVQSDMLGTALAEAASPITRVHING